MPHFDNMPPVPLTLEGSAVLHQMVRVRWPGWRALDAAERAAILDEASATMAAQEKSNSAAFSVLGHKGDLMLIHFRKDLDQLLEAQACLAHTRLWDYLDQTTSYLSVVELGLYESTLKTYTALAEKGVEPHTPEWNGEIEQTLVRQRDFVKDPVPAGS